MSGEINQILSLVYIELIIVDNELNTGDIIYNIKDVFVSPVINSDNIKHIYNFNSGIIPFQKKSINNI